MLTKTQFNRNGFSNLRVFNVKLWKEQSTRTGEYGVSLVLRPFEAKRLYNSLTFTRLVKYRKNPGLVSTGVTQEFQKRPLLHEYFFINIPRE